MRMSGPPATASHDVVLLLDVDNMLLDNDHIIADLRRHLERAFGGACAGRYWTHFEALRTELGYERISDLLDLDLPAALPPRRAGALPLEQP